MSPSDPVWDELGKIDYLLDQLARAVERGEAGREVYERIAPRYLERRADLVAVLSSRAGMPAPAVDRARSAEPPVPGRASAGAVVMGGGDAPGPEWDVARLAPAAAAPVAVRPRVAISPGTWMAYAGALLVVIAVAIFTIWAWPSLPAFAKLAVLAAVTTAFYLAGDAIRTRLDLPAVGIALTSVGSAMLLFDGWAVINGFGWTGALPWAAVLLVCSIAYWATELRIAGGWFGSIGAAAQIAWWWLLGEALGLETMWIAAGVAVVAVGWAWASGRAAEDGRFAVLDRVMRYGSLAVVAAVTPWMLGLAAVVPLSGGPRLEVAGAAAVVAIACTAVLERVMPRMRPLAVFAHAPVLVAALALWARRAADTLAAGGHAPARPGLDLIAIILVFALVHHVWAVLRGGGAFALTAVLSDVLLVVMLAVRGEWSREVTVGAFALIAALVVVSGRLLERASGEVAAPPARESALVWRWGGFGVLAVASAAALATGSLAAVLGDSRVGREAALFGWVLALWAVVSAVERTQAEGWAAWAWSLVAGAWIVAWVQGRVDGAYLALAVVALALGWSWAAGPAERVLRVPGEMLRAACRVAFLAAPLLLLGEVLDGDSIRFGIAVMMAGSALAWSVDSLRNDERRGMTMATASAVIAALVAGWRQWDASAGVVCATAAALVLAAAGLARSRERGSRASHAAWGAAIASTFALAFAGNDPQRVAALALTAATWAIATSVADLPELAGVSGTLLAGAVAALLHWRDPAPWVTVATLCASAGVLLVPRALVRAEPGARVVRLTRALAGAGAVTVAMLTAIALSDLGGSGLAGAHWDQPGGLGIAVAFLAAGAYAIAWTTFEGAEIGLYPGFAAIAVGLMVAMDHLGVGTGEVYLITVAIYAGAMGPLWSSRRPGRAAPVATDVAALLIAPAGALLLSVSASTNAGRLEHGLWALALAAASVALGRAVRTRAYFIGGIAVLVIDSLWMSRNVLLAMPSWVWIGLTGLALITGGVLFARRESLEDAARRVSSGFDGWR